MDLCVGPDVVSVSFLKETKRSPLLLLRTTLSGTEKHSGPEPCHPLCDNIRSTGTEARTWKVKTTNIPYPNVSSKTSYKGIL